MVQKKKFVPTQEQLQEAVSVSQEQVVGGGAERSTDANFPVWSVPVGKDVLVYVGKSQLKVVDGVEVFDILNAHCHDGKKGQGFFTKRCIKGIQGNNIAEILGYDGECPYCLAAEENWTLYNHKVKAIGAQKGVDPQNDPTEILKKDKEDLRDQFTIRQTDKYVVFPIVHIPNVEKNERCPAPNALTEMKGYYVLMRKQKYDEVIEKALEGLPQNPGHPAGIIWMWKYIYTTKNPNVKPNARDAARHLKCIPMPFLVDDPNYGETFKQLIAQADQIAAPFTNEKAVEVLTALEYEYKENIVSFADSLQSGVRMQIAQFEMMAGGGAVGLPAVVQTPNAPEAVLASFGVPQAPQAPQAPQQMGVAPPQMGVQPPIQPPQAPAQAPQAPMQQPMQQQAPQAPAQAPQAPMQQPMQQAPAQQPMQQAPMQQPMQQAPAQQPMQQQAPQPPMQQAPAQAPQAPAQAPQAPMQQQAPQYQQAPQQYPQGAAPVQFGASAPQG